ncbi:hypothetical protein EDEG_01615 [Edhazardia aedis USNM 41457]|uniref:Uncharacterized protein n=1 Tax=Edhazardia aedis (strain USNM 41457) TaxID=1003232 RepID=J8ZWR3_EDHAE|nr:hypothetical protein EDEG_01615 [Edhazardia aedis USNM 41457]|eukprot:EJW04093.1 hypothetical protein EDEG_01615 [Edhazardia aedis USNM 41457]
MIIYGFYVFIFNLFSSILNCRLLFLTKIAQIFSLRQYANNKILNTISCVCYLLKKIYFSDFLTIYNVYLHYMKYLCIDNLYVIFTKKNNLKIRLWKLLKV